MLFMIEIHYVLLKLKQHQMIIDYSSLLLLLLGLLEQFESRRRRRRRRENKINKTTKMLIQLIEKGREKQHCNEMIK